MISFLQLIKETLGHSKDFDQSSRSKHFQLFYQLQVFEPMTFFDLKIKATKLFARSKYCEWFHINGNYPSKKKSD